MEPLVSDIKYIGPALSLRLQQNGFTQVVEIANATPETLSQTPGIGLITAAQIIEAARALLPEKIEISLATTQSDTLLSTISQPEKTEKPIKVKKATQKKKKAKKNQEHKAKDKRKKDSNGKQKAKSKSKSKVKDTKNETKKSKASKKKLKKKA